MVLNQHTMDINQFKSRHNFKVVYTSNIVSCVINHRWTMTEFIDFVSNKVRENELVESQLDFEIVENNETNSKIQHSEVTFKQKYGKNIPYITFYIRPILIDQRLAIHENDCCPVCLENSPCISPFRCSHTFCNECTSRWINTGHDTCPCCRAYL